MTSHETGIRRGLRLNLLEYHHKHISEIVRRKYLWNHILLAGCTLQSVRLIRSIDSTLNEQVWTLSMSLITAIQAHQSRSLTDVINLWAQRRYILTRMPIFPLFQPRQIQCLPDRLIIQLDTYNCSGYPRNQHVPCCVQNISHGT